MPSTICRACGIVFQEGKKYCRVCGASLRLRYALLPSVVSSCEACAIQYVVSGRECALCGQLLAPLVEQVVEVGSGALAAQESPASPRHLSQDASQPFLKPFRTAPNTWPPLSGSPRPSRPAGPQLARLQPDSAGRSRDGRPPRLTWILAFLLMAGLGIAGGLGGMVLVTRFGAQPGAPQLTPQLASVESNQIEDGRQTTMRPRSTRSKKAKTHNARGLDLAGAGNIEGAIAEFRRAVAADPRNFTAHNNLGVLYQRKGLIPQAKREYEAASKAEPGSPVPYRNMAILNEDKSQLREALRNYSRYLDLAPHAPDRETILLKIRDLSRKMDSKSRG